MAPQLPQVPSAVVISTANTSRSSPATAFPSSINASTSSSRRSEAFCLDRLRVVPELYERLGGGLDKRGRTADVDTRPLRLARADPGQHLGVDASGVSRPAGGPRPHQRVTARRALTAELLELVAVDDVLPA